MRPYADSNYMVRIYYATPFSAEAAEWLTSLRSRRDGSLPITRLHRLEVMNALERHVFESLNGGGVRVTDSMAAIAQATFRDDCRESVFLRLCTPLEAAVDRQFEELVLRHTALRGFRTYDLLHVSQALVLGCDAFWSFDEKANALAALKGLSTRVEAV
jgi:predicted nucleic acid-binding protein